MSHHHHHHHHQQHIHVNEVSQRVVWLQQYLGNVGYDLVADGVFGQHTYAAVVHFQENAGLSADGIVGPQTWYALTGENGQPELG